jgi:hypothetical protein
MFPTDESNAVKHAGWLAQTAPSNMLPIYTPTIIGELFKEIVFQGICSFNDKQAMQKYSIFKSADEIKPARLMYYYLNYPLICRSRYKFTYFVDPVVHFAMNVKCLQECLTFVPSLQQLISFIIDLGTSSMDKSRVIQQHFLPNYIHDCLFEPQTFFIDTKQNTKYSVDMIYTESTIDTLALKIPIVGTDKLKASGHITHIGGYELSEFKDVLHVIDKIYVEDLIIMEKLSR